MAYLTKKECEILEEMEEEVIADIEMMERHFSTLQDLNSRKRISKNDLEGDILKNFNWRINKEQAMLEEIQEMEKEYGIKIEFTKLQKRKGAKK